MGVFDSTYKTKMFFALLQDVCSAHWHSYFQQSGRVVRDNAQSFFHRCYGVYMTCFCQGILTEVTYDLLKKEVGLLNI
jgi:hypothetical protein